MPVVMFTAAALTPGQTYTAVPNTLLMLSCEWSLPQGHNEDTAHWPSDYSSIRPAVNALERGQPRHIRVEPQKIASCSLQREISTQIVKF